MEPVALSWQGADQVTGVLTRVGPSRHHGRRDRVRRLERSGTLDADVARPRADKSFSSSPREHGVLPTHQRWIRQYVRRGLQVHALQAQQTHRRLGVRGVRGP
ncbi:hypothetical protein [Streptomyces europaeiscabiei]|uniref:hypothetical protein n=1 Tax=Streptomyces europaeiscabiei TaxID=146819 RepID=UPI000E68D94B|nr:hypothetical protein [Streptomyces europaeiscabiei]